MKRILAKAKTLIMNEGYPSLLRKIFGLPQRMIYNKRDFYVYRHNLIHFSTFDPPAPHCLFVSSLAQLESYQASKGLEVHQFEKDSITAFCRGHTGAMLVLIRGAIAHWSWVAFNRNSKIDVLSPLFRYNNAVYIGNCYTKPLFRGNGYFPYALTEICKFIKAAGYSAAYLVVSPSNLSSIRGVNKAGFECIAMGTLTERFLGKTWQEKGVTI